MLGLDCWGITGEEEVSLDHGISSGSSVTSHGGLSSSASGSSGPNEDCAGLLSSSAKAGIGAFMRLELIGAPQTFSSSSNMAAHQSSC